MNNEPLPNRDGAGRRGETAAAAALLLLALALRLYHLDWSLPYSYEEAKPLRVAWQMWGWDEGIQVDLNPKFFNYPSLTFYVHFLAQGTLYLGMKLFGSMETVNAWRVMQIMDPTPLFLAARAVSVLFAVATAWVVYRTARLVGGAGVALVALALLAVNPFHIARSQMVEVDVPLTFFVALALHGAVRIALEGRRRDYVLAGVATGLAASSKYTGALLLVPIVLAGLLFSRFSRRPARSRRGRFRNLGLAVLLVLVSFAVTSPYVLLDADEFRKDFRAEQEHMAFGHFGLDERPSWLYYATALAGDLVSVPVLIAALVGMVLAVRRRSHPAIVLAAFVVLYVAIVSTWTMRAERYLLPTSPPILVLAGAGLVAVVRRVHERLPRVHVAWVAAVLLAGVCAADAVGYVRHGDRYQGDTRTDVAKWLMENAPSGSYIVTEPYGPALVAPSLILTLDLAMRKEIISRIQNRPIFAVQNIPMFQVYPERSGRFYSLDLYENADYIVVSSGVASRYRRDPERFAPQIAFYDALAREFEKAREFLPARPGGLRLTVYGRATGAPFGLRPHIAPPPRLAPGGVNPIDARFYFEMGTNYEFFAKVAEASLSYRLAIERGTDNPYVFQSCVLGETRCLLAQGQGQEAVAFVRSLSERISDPTMRTKLTTMANQLADALRRQSAQR